MHEPIPDLLIVLIHLGVHLISEQALTSLPRLLSLHSQLVGVVRLVLLLKIIGHTRTPLMLPTWVQCIHILR